MKLLDYTYFIDNENLEQMYQEVILDESKSTDNRLYAIDDPNKSHHFNPSCGDDLTVSVKIDQNDENNKITDIKYAGEGCSISLASASIMARLLVNKTVSEAFEVCDIFSELMNSKGKGISEEKLDILDDASVFVGTSKFPARVKCALLAWNAFKGAIVNISNVNSNAKSITAVESGFSEHSKANN